MIHLKDQYPFLPTVSCLAKRDLIETLHSQFIMLDAQFCHIMEVVWLDLSKSYILSGRVIGHQNIFLSHRAHHVFYVCCQYILSGFKLYCRKNIAGAAGDPSQPPAHHQRHQYPPDIDDQTLNWPTMQSWESFRRNHKNLHQQFPISFLGTLHPFEQLLKHPVMDHLHQLSASQELLVRVPCN